MRILYGVVGEGMGHAMRSRVILEHLFEAGHEVEIMASGRAAEFLRKRFAERGWVHRIHGMHIVYDDNRVRKGSTLWSNVVSGVAALPRQIAAYFELIADFKAELVISDFESWTYHYAKVHRLPILSIDNMQVIHRCNLDPEVISGHKNEFELTKAFVKTKLPFCDEYLITSFFRPPVRKPHTELFPPILRPEILATHVSEGEHLLVYQTAEGGHELLDTLQKSGLECRVYGVRRNLTEEVVEGNLRFRLFSEAGFVSDLAQARGVIAGGGFTLMGEAVFLRKPMLAVPVRGQFEQVLNARYLHLLGYGRYAESLADPRHVAEFIAAIPRCAEALSGYSQLGNSEILAALDGHLARLG
ncbi:MAG: glycosyltransferase family protein [Polyangiaceae bacterium]|nr:glycosyltransferase family protein [Polyangiaceae bacterium]